MYLEWKDLHGSVMNREGTAISHAVIKYVHLLRWHVVRPHMHCKTIALINVI